ncbi:MAG: VIT1/CCC1 transporter family protein [Microgenomates group bacterium]
MQLINLRNIDSKYLKASVYGANDGIITTFAVVAGVAGAGLSPSIILILGIANMIADGISMGVGDFLGERSEQRFRKQQEKSSELEGLWKTGLVTFIAFVVAGSLPLVPYVLAALGMPIAIANQFFSSIVATVFALFLIGSLRTVLTAGVWWKNGLEMLSIGAIAAIVAYSIGAIIERMIS